MDERILPNLYGTPDRAQYIVREGGKLSFDPSKMQKEEFSHLGNWTQAMRPDGYGIAYRIATRQGIDREGDLATIVISYTAPLAKKGLEISPEKLQELDQNMALVMKTMTMMAVMQYQNENVIGVQASPPDWMYQELTDLLYK